MQLSTLLTLPVPSFDVPGDTFFDIIRQNSREITISRTYAYFMDRNKHSELADCFLESLKELILLKSNKKISLRNPRCRLEVITDKGNRIDLYLESVENGEAVIIENKIFHQVENDLADYWDSSLYKPNKKVGIILTLKPWHIPAPHNINYINITHREWINAALNRGLLQEVSGDKYVYIKAFVDNMNSLTKGNEFTEDVKFYFDHIKLVNNAVATQKTAREYIVGQFEQVAHLLGNDWELSDGNEDYQQIWNRKKAYYTVITDKLYDGQNLVVIVLELYSDANDERVVYDLRNHLQKDDSYKMLNPGDRTKYYTHLVFKEYEVMNEDLKQFSAFIYDRIQCDFAPLMEQVLLFFKENYSWSM